MNLLSNSKTTEETLKPNSDVAIQGDCATVKQENNWVKLRTFDSDLDDVLYSAQAVCGCTAVVPSIGFIHIRNLECFLEVLKGHPVARQLSSILLPGDLWSGPVIDEITQLYVSLTNIAVKQCIVPCGYTRCLLTSPQRCIPAPESPLSEPSWYWWCPEASWNRDDAPPLGCLKTRGHTIKSEPDRNIRFEGSPCHTVTTRVVGWNNEGLRGPFVLSWREKVA